MKEVFVNISNNNQLTISYELLYLMQWLLENESERIKKLIVQVLEKGFKKEMLAASKAYDPSTNQELKHSVVDFLNLLDALLQEAMNEQALKKITEKNLIPALNQLDDTVCGSSLIQGSLEKVSLKFESHPQENPQELLFKELLKRWKPDKKIALN